MTSDPRIRYDIEAGVGGTADVNKLATELERLDEAVDPTAAARAKQLATELRVLGQQQAAVDNFRRLKDATAQAGAELTRAQAAAQQLGREIAATGTPTRTQAGQMEKLRDAVRQARTAQIEQTQALQQARTTLQGYGIDTDRLAGVQTKLNARTTEAARDATAITQAYKAQAAAASTSGDRQADAARKVGTGLRDARQEAAGLGDALGNARGAMVGLAAGAAGLVAVVKQAMEFESAMADVAKVVDGSEEQIAALAHRLKELSTELPISADGLAEIAAAGGQLGIPIEKLEQFTRLAAQMSTAFNISAAEAGEAVAKLSNVFNLPIEGVEKLGDAINTLGNTTAAKEKDIVEVLTRVGGAARQFGLTGEQAAALASTFLSLGTSAEVSATGINAMLTKLQTANVQSKDFKEALGQLGLSAEELAKAISEKPQEALTEFLRTLDKLDSKSRAEILSRLFGLEYQDDIARLLGSLGQYEQALGRVGDKATTSGAMAKEFETRLKTTEAQLKLLNNSVEVLAVNLGSSLLPAINSAASGLVGLTSAAASVAEQAPAVSSLAVTLVTVTASIAGLRLAFGAMSALATKAFGDLRTAAGALTKPIGAAVEAMGRVNAAMGVLSAALIGWDVGKYLAREFESVRLAGIALAQGLTEMASRAQLAWEKLVAVYTSDTWAAAEQRHLQRMREIQRIYGDIAEDATASARKQQKGSEQAAAAADKQAGALDKTAKSAQQAGAAAEAAGNTSAEASKKAGEAAEEAGKKMAEAGDKAADASAQAVDKVTALQQAAQSLGLDMDQLATGISGSFTKSLAGFDVLLASFEELRAQGINQVDALKAALSNMIDQAKSKAEFDALRERINMLVEAQRLSRYEADKLLQTLAEKTAPAVASIDELTEAARRLGVTLSAQVKGSVEDATQAYIRLKTSGRLSAEELQRAFTNMSRQVLAANGGVVTAWMHSEAAAQGLAFTVDRTGRVIVEAMSEAVPSIQAVGTAAAEATDSVKELLYESEKASQAAAGANASGGRGAGNNGFTRTAIGQNMQSIMGLLKGWGLSDAQAQSLAREFVDPNTGYLPAFGRSTGHATWARSEYDTWSVALQRAAQDMLYNRNGLAGQEASGAGGLRAAPPGRVEIKLGSQTTTVNTASIGDQQALVGVFRELESAAGVSVR